MASHFKGPLLGSKHSLGGAAENLAIAATAGDSDTITTFDDFDGVVATDEFGAGTNWETLGWVLTDDAAAAPVADSVSMNDPAVVAEWAPSCIKVFAGTTDDTGGNMQLDRINGSLPASSGALDFPHLWIPETAAGVTVLDNTIWTFSCRIGLRADLEVAGGGAWNSKAFVGWAAAGDTSIMEHDTGAITIASGGPLVGFHIPVDGSIDGISHRTAATAMAEGTNFTELAPAASVHGTVANGAVVAGDTVWYDLALRMNITDMSDDDANGETTFWSRRVRQLVGDNADTPGRVGRPASDTGDWVQHGTVLQNQTPNHTVALVPTIELLNGATATLDGVLFLDWWAMSCSRYSRSGK